MSLIKNIFGKEEEIKSYEDFWNWFKKNEKRFFKIVQEGKKEIIHKNLFDVLTKKLDQINEGFFYEVGMPDEETVELIFTADGNIENMVFMEELVNSSIKINGWIFTALKPSLDIEDVNISTGGLSFNESNISFYTNENSNYPDEIDITVVYTEIVKNNELNFERGVLLFLEAYLGELNFASTIDNVKIVAKTDSKKELVPIEKIKDYLIWRQKEFIEKYEGLRYDTENDAYSLMEAELESGNTLIAVINSDLLEWDKKASHPWLIDVELEYDENDNNGMPDKKTYKLMNIIEEAILYELKDFEGYLNIGRQTSKGKRNIYFACKEFRKPSKVLYKIQKKFSSKIGIAFEIYKDKYWQTLDSFRE